MVDEQSGTPATDEPIRQDAGAAESPGGPRKSMPPWAWIIIAVVAVAILLGVYLSTQTEQGQLWLLSLRGEAEVPSVIGQTQTDAEATLAAAGFKLGQVSEEPTLAVAPGSVSSQTPAPGASAKKDSAVDVVLATIPKVKVPNVVGETQSNAITLLAEEGLRAGTIEYVYDAKVAAGMVTAQDPAASSEIAVGAAVNLTVSKGAQQGQVPNVIGLPQDDAVAVIEADGFVVTTVKATSTSVPAGDVISQSPAAGVVAPAGSTVTITVSTGAPASTTPPPTTEAAPAEPQTPETPSTPETPETPATPDQPAPAPETVEVPDVVGMSAHDAVSALKAADLKVKFEYAPSEKDPLKIIAQDPEAGAEVDPGTTITITLGLPSISLPEGGPVKPEQLPAQPETVAPSPQ